MSTVLFKRSANINEIPIVDGQLVFDETHNKIYMDNGSERLQYGGDVSLIEDTSYATSNNTFSANGSLNIFTQKLSVIDNKDSVLAATEQHVPVGCLAFQSAIGNADYSEIGNTISDSLVTLKNNITNQLSANNNKFYFDYQDGKYGYNTDPQRGADTFSPFRELKTVYLGKTGQNYDLTSYNGWQDFTNDNFYFRVVSISMHASNNVIPNNNVNNGAISGPSFSYNNKTGILTVGGASGSGSNDGGKLGWSISADISVYLVYA